MIKKFRSFEEASKDLWNINPDAAYYNRVRAFLDLWARLAPQKPLIPRLIRFRSIEEASSDIKSSSRDNA